MSHGHGHAAEGASEESIAAGYEVNDAKVRPLVFATVAVFALIALAFVLIAGLLFVTGDTPVDTSNRVNATAEQLPPEPRVEQNPNIDGDRIVGEAAERLETFGWVQQGAGRAHIPIKRAEELLIEKGIAPFGSGQ